MFRKVLAGVDGFQGGHDAVALARQLAAPSASFVFAHVYSAGLMPGRGAALLREAELDESRKVLERARRAASGHAQPLPYVHHSAAPGLHALGERVGADLLVSDPPVVGQSRARCSAMTSERGPIVATEIETRREATVDN